MKKTLSALSILFSLSVASASYALQVHMAGDSTMAIKDSKDYPETGWGVPFATFFNEGVTVFNHAKNGRSTRTFIEEGRWQDLLVNVEAGDVVIIQFGHNDEVERKKDRYTPPADYKTNIQSFIADVRKRKATPILMTPVTRRYFDDQGSIKQTHVYSPLVREIAMADSTVLMIDMDEITRRYFTDQGDIASALRFMHIQPNLHPNYPNGVTDDTHFNELGAREVAQLVLAELKRLQHPLVDHLRPVDPKHLKLSYKH